MKGRGRFQPGVGELESRVVLNHHRSTFSVITGGLLPGAHTVQQGQHAPIVALINTAFDLFQSDYTQARSAYFGAVANRTATMADQMAFNNYTTQRVEVLAQQLSNSLLQTKSSTLRGHRSQDPVTVIGRRISGPNPGQMGNSTPFAFNTLGFALITSTPAPGSSSTTVALDALAQDNAVEAARNAMLNAVVIIKNGDFGNQVTHQQ
jgi:hypothetical protein